MTFKQQLIIHIIYFLTEGSIHRPFKLIQKSELLSQNDYYHNYDNEYEKYLVSEYF